MHVAVAIGIMLLGGPVLNSPTDDEQPAANDQNQPAQGAPAAADAARAGRTNSQPVRSRSRNLQGGQTGRGAGVMPIAPTDPGAQGMAGHAAPMRNTPAPSGGRNAMPFNHSPYSSRLMAAPTQRLGVTGDATPHSMMTGGGSKHGLNTEPNNHNAGFMTPATTVDKPFSSYRPQSGVSPYMNLFRSHTGGADNYSTLVKPEIDQRFANQRFNQNIYGLERNARQQAAGLQQLNQQQMQATPGVGTPQFYMNSGGNNPGYGQ
jgi:hypothetical protein